MRDMMVSCLSGEISLLAWDECGKRLDLPLPWGGSVQAGTDVPDGFPCVTEVVVNGPIGHGVLVLFGGPAGQVRTFDLPALTSAAGWRHIFGESIRVSRVEFTPHPQASEPALSPDHEREIVPPKPDGHHVSVICERCHHVTAHALGALDPKESRCTHSFVMDIKRGMMGAFVCTNCELAVDVRTLLDAGIEPTRRYSKDGNDLADEAQRLRDENTKVLAENARLRMHVERLERRRSR